MKKYQLIIILVIPFLGFGQANFNLLTQNEFEAITFNSVSLQQLMNFEGELNDIINHISSAKM